MAIDRARWEGTLYPLPRWLCPTCQQGHLQIIGDASTAETGQSERARRDKNWEPEWTTSRFSALLRCDHDACREVAVVCGTTSVVEAFEAIDDGEDEVQVLVDGFRLVAIQPAPLPFQLGPEIPKDVADLIRKAAELYWMDPEASANKLRQAIEAMLTEQGVRRTIISMRRKREHLSLHARIIAYQQKRPEAAHLLFAVKWLGNAGSHVGGLKQRHVLDGFEMLDLVLDEAYRKTRARLAALAKDINRNKGPRRVSRRGRRKRIARAAPSP